MYVAHHHWLTFMAASVLRTAEFQRAARDLPTVNAYHPLLWFFHAALGGGPCIVPDRYLVAGSLDISWTDRRAEILTLHFTSLWDEGLSADLSAEQFGRTLDGLYASDGFDLGLWRTVGLDHLAEAVAKFPQSRALRWALLIFARDRDRRDLVSIVDQAARSDGAGTISEQLVAAGEQQFVAGDHEAAIGSFTEATRWLPTCTDAWNDLAVAAHQLGLDQARDHLEMALFIDPADHQALSNRDALLGVPHPTGQPAARA
jgi:tetratricopeptide (TPR) repeat protein